MHKKSALIRIVAAGSVVWCLARPSVVPAREDTVIDGLPAASPLEAYDAESRQIFMQNRSVLDQRERALDARVNAVTDNLVYDMHREVAAEMMLRYDTEGKIAEVRSRKQQVLKNIQVENEDYAEVLIKLRNIEEELLARGIELKSVVLQNVDAEIGNVKRKLTRDALKKILAYEKQKRSAIIRDVLHDKNETVIEDEKETKKRQMLLEIVQLGGASPELEKLVNDQTRPIEQIREDVVAVLGTGEYNRKVNELQEKAREKRRKIARLFSMEQDAYERLRRKISELKVIVDRSKLIKSGTPAQRTRMARREYRNALVHYVNGEYRVAALKVEAILKDYPDFTDKSTALFVLAESKLATNRFEEAEGRYLELLLDYAGSPLAGMALYRLMDIAYLFGDFTKITDYDTQFAAVAADTALAASIRYMVGRSLYFQGRFAEARSSFARVAGSFDLVPAARYMQGLCYVNEDSLDAAVTMLERCMEDALPNIALDLSIRQLYDGANVALGHLLFKLERYEDALTAYNRVDRQSHRYEEVLLGKMWVAFAIEAFDRTVSYAALITGRYPSSDYYYEVMVMKGVALSKLGMYAEASDTYGQIIAIQDGIDLLDDYAMTRVAVEALSQRILAAERKMVAQVDTAGFVRVRRISRGLDKSVGILYSCENYVKTLFTVEEMNARVARMRGRLSAVTENIVSAVNDLALMSREARDIQALARDRKDESAMTEADLEFKKMQRLLSRLRGMEADAIRTSVATRNASLRQAVERSECGRLDVDFARQQESRGRIRDIKAINQSIDQILNDVESSDPARQ